MSVVLFDEALAGPEPITFPNPRTCLGADDETPAEFMSLESLKEVFIMSDPSKALNTLLRIRYKNQRSTFYGRMVTIVAGVILPILTEPDPSGKISQMYSLFEHALTTLFPAGVVLSVENVPYWHDMIDCAKGGGRTMSVQRGPIGYDELYEATILYIFHLVLHKTGIPNEYLALAYNSPEGRELWKSAMDEQLAQQLSYLLIHRKDGEPIIVGEPTELFAAFRLHYKGYGDVTADSIVKGYIDDGISSE